MYSMVTTANNIVLYILKLLKKQMLKVLTRRKKIFVITHTVTGVNWTCDDHFITNTNTESYCYTPETNIMLRVHYTSIKKKRKNKKSKDVERLLSNF